MKRITDRDALVLCENAQHRHPLDRALLLAAFAQPQSSWDALADLSVGRRNAELLRLRCANYGDSLVAYIDCPECHERLELNLSGEQLLSLGNSSEAGSVVIDDWSFRLPGSRDLAMVVPLASEPERAVLALLSHCCITRPAQAGEADLVRLVPMIAEAMEQKDPQADVRLDLHCEFCGHRWLALFDPSSFLLEELEAHSARVLDDVHLLASAYGWSETQVLALSEKRRAAYRERVLR